MPGRFEGRGEQVARVADVVGGDFPDGVVDVGAPGGEFTDLLLVGRAVLERGLEDRRFVVTPTMCESAIRSFRFPDCNRCRDKSSSHRETPAAERSARGLFVLCGVVMM